MIDRDPRGLDRGSLGTPTFVRIGRWLTRLARSRRGPVLAIVLLVILSVVTLYMARDTDQYAGNLLLNIGASFVGAIITYALINPMMARAEDRADKVLDKFDHAMVMLRINEARSLVRVFETGIPLLDERHKRRFLSACRAALRGGVKIEILLLDPDSRAAEQRADELRDSTTRLREMIRLNLREFDRFRAELHEHLQRRFEVRLYSTAPVVAYYRWDWRALISFFPPNRSSEYATQYETSVDSSFAQFVEQSFQESWDNSSTYPLEQYFAMPIGILAEGADEEEEEEAEWVIHGDNMYLASRALTNHAVTTGLSNMRVRLLHIAPWNGSWGLTICDPTAPAHRYFDAKYGTGQRMILQIHAVEEPADATPAAAEN
ncbi:MAG TPA: hypothetical protein VHA75_15595 [Rugosimonospora sp.]|nr:hypothetical protein [Rugosimonospora sp.]